MGVSVHGGLDLGSMLLQWDQQSFSFVPKKLTRSGVGPFMDHIKIQLVAKQRSCVLLLFEHNPHVGGWG